LVFVDTFQTIILRYSKKLTRDQNAVARRGKCVFDLYIAGSFSQQQHSKVKNKNLVSHLFWVMPTNSFFYFRKKNYFLRCQWAWIKRRVILKVTEWLKTAQLLPISNFQRIRKYQLIDFEFCIRFFFSRFSWRNLGLIPHGKYNNSLTLIAQKTADEPSLICHLQKRMSDYVFSATALFPEKKSIL
jgi:hypothetical protein